MYVNMVYTDKIIHINMQTKENTHTHADRYKQMEIFFFFKEKDYEEICL